MRWASRRAAAAACAFPACSPRPPRPSPSTSERRFRRDGSLFSLAPLLPHPEVVQLTCAHSCAPVVSELPCLLAPLPAGSPTTTPSGPRRSSACPPAATRRPSGARAGPAGLPCLCCGAAPPLRALQQPACQPPGRPPAGCTWRPPARPCCSHTPSCRARRPRRVSGIDGRLVVDVLRQAIAQGQLASFSLADCTQSLLGETLEVRWGRRAGRLSWQRQRSTHAGLLVGSWQRSMQSGPLSSCHRALRSRAGRALPLPAVRGACPAVGRGGEFCPLFTMVQAGLRMSSGSAQARQCLACTRPLECCCPGRAQHEARGQAQLCQPPTAAADAALGRPACCARFSAAAGLRGRLRWLTCSA